MIRAIGWSIPLDFTPEIHRISSQLDSDDSVTKETILEVYHPDIERLNQSVKKDPLKQPARLSPNACRYPRSSRYLILVLLLLQRRILVRVELSEQRLGAFSIPSSGVSQRLVDCASLVLAPIIVVHFSTGEGIGPELHHGIAFLLPVLDLTGVRSHASATFTAISGVAKDLIALIACNYARSTRPIVVAGP